LVVSDIHSNQEALEEVLKDANFYGRFTDKICAGDIIGYGPNPNEVITILQEQGFISIIGNHDQAILTGDYTLFNHNAERSARYNDSILTAESRAYLRSLQFTPYIDPSNAFALVHASFNAVVSNGSGLTKVSRVIPKRYYETYLLSEDSIVDAINSLDFEEATTIRQIPLGIFGHTHVPTFAQKYILPLNKEIIIDAGFIFDSREITFNSSQKGIVFQNSQLVPKALFNPGSVGQPRHGKPNACYGIIEIDGDTIQLHYMQVEYNVAETQRRMQKAEFPLSLIQRLEYGV